MKELKRSNMPSRAPLISTLVVWMALDHWHAPLWLYGALGTVFLFLWIGFTYAMATGDAVDIIERVEAREKEVKNAIKPRILG